MLGLYLNIVLFLSISHSQQVSSLNDEGLALISFKTSINEDPNKSMNNWNLFDENPCSWNGISCKDEKVVSLSIPKKGLKGTLSPSLGSLLQLRHVNLRSNKLFGTLPFELFKPLGLQSLVLFGNSFSGYVPNEIGKLFYLQSLDLSHNLFNGSLPVSFTQCKRMRTLDLGNNSFSGYLPKGLGDNLVLLEKLDLSFNNFSGLIPDDLGNLSSLQGTMDLSHNQFSGSIPSSLGDLPEKVYIDLTYNNLSGAIPQNGALMNRGPTAFIGNPNLCGPPLRNPCSDNGSALAPSTYPYLPSSYPSQNSTSGNRGGLRKGALISIIVGDVVGICIIGLVFSYCYSRVCPCRKRKNGSYGFEKGGKGRRECLCFRKDESETLSENVEPYDLVPLDAQVAFDLDELLKASAFVLGKSGIGIVYKVVLEDGLNLAVRRLGEGGSQRFKEFQTEVEAIGKLRHRNIVTLRAYYWSVDEKLLIYDYIRNGNLATAIHGKAGMVTFTPLPWSSRLKIMKGVARGLVYLHECSPKKYVHGDLKPANILLDEDMEPKISNFGLGRLANIAGTSPTLQSSRIITEKSHQRQLSNVLSEVPTLIGSNVGLSYQAPEALKMVKPSQKWDVYSFGVVLLELLSGKLPIIQVGTSEMDLVNWIQLSIEEKKPLSEVMDPCFGEEDVDKEEEIIAVLKIAMVCIQSGPERRPTMRYISDALERLGD